MAKDTKPIVEMKDTFDRLDIRVGRVIEVEMEATAPKPSYRMKVDFGKFGVRTSIGRFTKHTREEILNRLVLGVLNFEPRQIGDVLSEVLILGVQFPKADSGEATPISPSADAKIGSKLF